MTEKGITIQDGYVVINKKMEHQAVNHLLFWNENY